MINIPYPSNAPKIGTDIYVLHQVIKLNCYNRAYRVKEIGVYRMVVAELAFYSKYDNNDRNAPATPALAISGHIEYAPGKWYFVEKLPATDCFFSEEEAIRKLQSMTEKPVYWKDPKSVEDPHRKPAEPENREYFLYLDWLRNSGQTNMWGASPYLASAFPELDAAQADALLTKWIQSFF